MYFIILLIIIKLSLTMNIKMDKPRVQPLSSVTGAGINFGAEVSGIDLTNLTGKAH